MLAVRGASLRALLALAVVATAACGGAPRRTALMERGGIDASTVELRIYVNEYVVNYASVLERASDRIRDAATAEEQGQIALRALQWKSRMVPAAQITLFQPDPAASLLDLWVLTQQQANFLGTGGPGAGVFGANQPVALAALAELEEAGREVLARWADDDVVARAEQIVDDFAAQNPIRGTDFVRTSILPAFSEFISSASGTGQSAFGSVGSLNETATDLNGKLSILSASLPRQARWEAELLLQQLPAMQGYDDLFATAAMLREPASDVAALLDAIESGELRRIVAAERQAVLDGVDLQRRDTLEALRAERAAVLAAVTEEREAVLAELDRQRLDTLRELERQSESLVDDSSEEALARFDRIADRVVYRVALLLVAALLYLGVLALFIASRFAPLRPGRPRRSEADEG
ncbi:MAG: hypothetical protein ACFCGT_01490 [Sandaracinaceae bacterium]